MRAAASVILAASLAALWIAFALSLQAAPPARATPMPATEAESQALLAEKARARLAPPPPLLTADEALALVATVVAAASVATLAASYAFERRDESPAFARHRFTIGAGAALMLLGPSALWGAWGALHPFIHAAPPGWMPPWMPSGLVWLPLGGGALFGLGFVVVGSGLRPRGSFARGALLAATVYALLGLVWVVAFNTLGGAPLFELVRSFRDPFVLALILLWPVQVAQSLGLFGLRFG